MFGSFRYPPSTGLVPSEVCAAHRTSTVRRANQVMHGRACICVERLGEFGTCEETKWKFGATEKFMLDASTIHFYYYLIYLYFFFANDF